MNPNKILKILGNINEGGRERPENRALIMGEKEVTPPETSRLSSLHT
jgi:hypothetical protein